MLLCYMDGNHRFLAVPRLPDRAVKQDLVLLSNNVPPGLHQHQRYPAQAAIAMFSESIHGHALQGPLLPHVSPSHRSAASLPFFGL